MNFLKSLFNKKSELSDENTGSSTEQINEEIILPQEILSVEAKITADISVTVHTELDFEKLINRMYNSFNSLPPSKKIFVTGRAAYGSWSYASESMLKELKNYFDIVFPPPDNPTPDAILQLLNQYKSSIKKYPLKKQICFTPAYSDVVSDYLFFIDNANAKSYEASIYLVGLHEDQLTFIDDLNKCINYSKRAKGSLECFISLDDSRVTTSEREKLESIKEPEKISKIWSEILKDS